MSDLIEKTGGHRRLFMGNEAIARGALEAGVSVAAGYPGTPSSEIIENLAGVAGDAGIYVEWSVNEKVALEVSAAASFAGMRALCAMKQNGVNVASDFLLHLAGSGTRGGLVLIPCDDPGALSSINEGESRHFARMLEIPLLEPGDFQEAKDMTRWAFELSEELQTIVMLRSVTRLSHASGIVETGPLPDIERKARFYHDGFILDPLRGAVISAPVDYKHGQQQEKIRKAAAKFEESPFNTYVGPDHPELLIVTGSVCSLYSREAVNLLNAGDRVGVLKLGTTWPLPPNLMKRYFQTTGRILVVEEVIPFLEENIKILAAELPPEIGVKRISGKRDGMIPMTGELNPDLVAAGIARVLQIEYQAVNPEYVQKAQQLTFFHAPGRDLTFCPGCPHRASFWSIKNVLEMDGRNGFVCGDIGCYSMAVLPCGFSTIKTMHAMGSGTGIASGFGKFDRFGMDQPVLSVCGDSTFFHSALPALVNAVHHRARINMVILDNSGTAMTGFQPHPGLAVDAEGHAASRIDIANVCASIGARVDVCDPFDFETTQKTLFNLLERNDGVNVLILRQICALSPEKKHKKKFEMSVDAAICRGEACGCNRFCTRIFSCPGLVWDGGSKNARIDEVICAGCGVCAAICPAGAIKRKEAV